MALEDLNLRPRESGPTRCALCRGDFEEDPHRCPGCATLTHADCLAAAGACPTIGCTERGESRPASSRPPAPGLGPEGRSGERTSAIAPTTTPERAAAVPTSTRLSLGITVLWCLFALGYMIVGSRERASSPKDGNSPRWRLESFEQLRGQRAESDLRSWVLLYQAERGRPPASGEDLATWWASWVERDPARRQVHTNFYRVRGDGPRFVVTDLGLDGAPGGTGRDADVTLEATISADGVRTELRQP